MASYNPGTYEGTGRGYGGKLIVSVTVSENRIESVKVTQHKEYRGIAWGLNTTPMERYPKLIAEYQTLNIPTVDGADLTCAAILDATAATLKAAGLVTDERHGQNIVYSLNTTVMQDLIGWFLGFTEDSHE